MRNRLPARFWIESVIGAVALAMFVLTLVWPDWIEGIFGADPDGGNGSAEWGWTAAFAVAAFILAVDAGRMRARARRSWASSR